MVGANAHLALAREFAIVACRLPIEDVPWTQIRLPLEATYTIDLYRGFSQEPVALKVKLRIEDGALITTLENIVQ